MSEFRTFFKYVIPSILSFALSGVYAIVDGYFVGNSIGDIGLSTIMSPTPLPPFFRRSAPGSAWAEPYITQSAERNKKRNGRWNLWRHHFGF